MNLFKVAAMTALGLDASVALGGYLTVFLEALNARNWQLARGLVDQVMQKGLLTPEQRAALVVLMTEHHIP